MVTTTRLLSAVTMLWPHWVPSAMVTTIRSVTWRESLQLSSCLEVSLSSLTSWVTSSKLSPTMKRKWELSTRVANCIPGSWILLDLQTTNLCQNPLLHKSRRISATTGLKIDLRVSILTTSTLKLCLKRSRIRLLQYIYSPTSLNNSKDSSTSSLSRTPDSSMISPLVSCPENLSQPRRTRWFMTKKRRCQKCTLSWKVSSELASVWLLTDTLKTSFRFLRGRLALA